MIMTTTTTTMAKKSLASGVKHECFAIFCCFWYNW